MLLFPTTLFPHCVIFIRNQMFKVLLMVKNSLHQPTYFLRDEALPGMFVWHLRLSFRWEECLRLLLTLLLVEFALLLGGGVLVLLVLGHQVVHVGLGLSELHLVHALTSVPAQAGKSREAKVPGYDDNNYTEHFYGAPLRHIPPTRRPTRLIPPTRRPTQHIPPTRRPTQRPTRHIPTTRRSTRHIPALPNEWTHK